MEKQIDGLYIGHVVNVSFPISRKFFGQNIVLLNNVKYGRNMHKIYVYITGEPDAKKEQDYLNLQLQYLKDEWQEKIITKYQKGSGGKNINANSKRFADMFVAQAKREKKHPVLIHEFFKTLKGFQKMREKEITYIFWAHSPPRVYGIHSRGGKILEKLDGIVSVSEKVKEEYKEIVAAEIDTVPNGIDFNIYNPSIKEGIDRHLRKLGLSGLKIVSFIGRTSKIKGAHILSSLINEISKISSMNDMLFLVAMPPTRDMVNHFLPSLSKKALDRVIFIVDYYKFIDLFDERIKDGAINLIASPYIAELKQTLESVNAYSEDKVKVIYERPVQALASVHLQLSLLEAYGLAQIEAISLGTPVISFNTEGAHLITTRIGSSPMYHVIQLKKGEREYLMRMAYGAPQEGRTIEKRLIEALEKYLDLRVDKEESERVFKALKDAHLSAETMAQMAEAVVYNIVERKRSSW